MIKTRILIISDTHCASLSKDGPKSAPESPFRLPMPQADVLIHCGDLTNQGGTDEYLRTLDMLKQIDAPVKLVIAGNHDLSLDRDWVLAHRQGDYRMPGELSESDAEARYDAARHLWTSPDGRARREGITFLDEGTHLIELRNGASLKVYATPYTPGFYDWGLAYEHDEDRFNSPQHGLQDAKNISRQAIASRNEKDRPLDIVISHGPPWQRLDLTQRGPAVGCPHLLRGIMRARPLISCFGHIHEAWGAERVKWVADVAEIAERPESLQAFMNGGWRAAMVGDGSAEPLRDIDEGDLAERHAVYVDLSQSSKRPLRHGRTTAFINAAIMDVRGRAANAPWLVEIDLPVNEK